MYVIPPSRLAKGAPPFTGGLGRNPLSFPGAIVATLSAYDMLPATATAHNPEDLYRSIDILGDQDRVLKFVKRPMPYPERLETESLIRMGVHPEDLDKSVKAEGKVADKHQEYFGDSGPEDWEYEYQGGRKFLSVFQLQTLGSIADASLPPVIPVILRLEDFSLIGDSADIFFHDCIAQLALGLRQFSSLDEGRIATVYARLAAEYSGQIKQSAEPPTKSGGLRLGGVGDEVHKEYPVLPTAIRVMYAEMPAIYSFKLATELESALRSRLDQVEDNEFQYEDAKWIHLCLGAIYAQSGRIDATAPHYDAMIERLFAFDQAKRQPGWLDSEPLDPTILLGNFKACLEQLFATALHYGPTDYRERLTRRLLNEGFGGGESAGDERPGDRLKNLDILAQVAEGVETAALADHLLSEAEALHQYYAVNEPVLSARLAWIRQNKPKSLYGEKLHTLAKFLVTLIQVVCRIVDKIPLSDDRQGNAGFDLDIFKERLHKIVLSFSESIDSETKKIEARNYSGLRYLIKWDMNLSLGLADAVNEGEEVIAALQGLIALAERFQWSSLVADLSASLETIQSLKEKRKTT